MDAFMSMGMNTNFYPMTTASNVKDGLNEGIEHFTKAGAKFMRSIIPIKSGKLRDSIHYDKDQIWSTSQYYEFIDDGVKARTITGNPLMFYINGVQVFTRSVNHPGFKAYKITDKVADYMDEHLDIVANEIWKEL